MANLPVKSGRMVTALREGMTAFKRSLSPIVGSVSRGWNTLIREPFAGAWQRNLEIKAPSAAHYSPVYSCVTLIGNDIGKLPFVVKRFQSEYWKTQAKNPYSWLNSNPNSYQTGSMFRQSWTFSRLLFGNTYVLIERDSRGRIAALHVLDPSLVMPMVTDTGRVYYQVSSDKLTGSLQSILIPASEIIHDRINCLFHPLVGISPLYAAAAAVNVGLAGQAGLAQFLGNASTPSGILTIPGEVSDETADEMSEYFNSSFTGPNAGKIAVLSGDVKFERMSASSQDSQLLEHLKWSTEQICSVFHVPSSMVLGGDVTNVAALRERYYGQCLQSIILSMQECLDRAFELDDEWAIELDYHDFLRADPVAHISMLSAAVKGALMTIDEARFRLDLQPIPGGDTVYLQQQYYSLASLAERDKNSPLLPAPAPAVTPEATPELDHLEEEDIDLTEEEEREIHDMIFRAMGGAETR